MILNDREIKQLAHDAPTFISPFQEKNVNPASYDLCLSGIESLTNPEHKIPEEKDEEGIIELMPHEVVRAGSIERIHLPKTLVGTVMFKSSMFRKGLALGSTGLVDPGYQGTITVLLINTTQKSINLRYTQRFIQIKFDRINEVENAYNGRYQGSTKITGEKE